MNTIIVAALVICGVIFIFSSGNNSDKDNLSILDLSKINTANDNDKAFVELLNEYLMLKSYEHPSTNQLKYLEKSASRFVMADTSFNNYLEDCSRGAVKDAASDECTSWIRGRMQDYITTYQPKNKNRLEAAFYIIEYAEDKMALFSPEYKTIMRHAMPSVKPMSDSEKWKIISNYCVIIEELAKLELKKLR